MLKILILRNILRKLQNSWKNSKNNTILSLRMLVNTGLANSWYCGVKNLMDFSQICKIYCSLFKIFLAFCLLEKSSKNNQLDKLIMYFTKGVLMSLFNVVNIWYQKVQSIRISNSYESDFLIQNVHFLLYILYICCIESK